MYLTLLYFPVCSECPHYAISWVKWDLWPSRWQKLSNSLLNEQTKLHPFLGDEYCLDKYEYMVTPHKEISTRMLAYTVEEGSMGARKNQLGNDYSYLTTSFLEQSRTQTKVVTLHFSQKFMAVK